MFNTKKVQELELKLQHLEDKFKALKNQLASSQKIQLDAMGDNNLNLVNLGKIEKYKTVFFNKEYTTCDVSIAYILDMIINYLGIQVNFKEGTESSLELEKIIKRKGHSTKET